MSKLIRQAKVISTNQITPHLQRIVIGSRDFKDFTDKSIGHHVKVLIHKENKNAEELNAKTAYMRSYTIQNVNPVSHDLTLDFVINMHEGPATQWAKSVKVGGILAIMGPGPKKLDDLNQPHYILLGDLTSVNAIKGYLQQLPPSAKIDAFIHVPSKQDIIDLDTNRTVNWIVTTTPEQCVPVSLDELAPSTSSPTIFMALEAELVTLLKAKFINEYSIPRSQIVASGYWKKGVDSERYKALRLQAPNNER